MCNMCQICVDTDVPILCAHLHVCSTSSWSPPIGIAKRMLVVRHSRRHMSAITRYMYAYTAFTVTRASKHSRECPQLTAHVPERHLPPASSTAASPATSLVGVRQGR